MLRIEHLTKKYGEKVAVDDLSLHIAPGEIYGFIGHNGAGKTTTLKSAVGILNFDEGEIFIDGISIRENPLEAKRRLAYIPDNPDLYDFMSGIKYLNFIADVFGVSAAARQERIRELAERFKLTADLAQPIASYSHGMKQKLALISAFLCRPGPDRFASLKADDARALRPRRRHLFLHARPGSRREALRQGGDHQKRPADPFGYDGRSEGRRFLGGGLPGTGGEIKCWGQ